MKKQIIWWAIKNKKGEILLETIARYKRDSALEAPQEFGGWWSLSGLEKRINKKGYTFCRVKIEEVKK